MATNFGIKTLI